MTKTWLFGCVAAVMSVVYVVRGARRTTNVVYVTTKDTRRDVLTTTSRVDARKLESALERAMGSARRARL